ncbi:MAG: ribonuclease P protein component [Pseudomonadota bacterium]
MCAWVNSLKASSDFQRVSRLGRKCVFPAFIMLALRREGEEASFRLGLTVSRKVGNAVVRNRAKRRLREAARQCLLTDKSGGFDIVLIGRASAKERDFSLIKQDFLKGMERLGMTA